MRRRLRTIASATVAAMLVIPALIMNVASPADAASCIIVSNPTPTSHTECPDANLAFANLSKLNLDYANLSGANLQNADLSYSALDYGDLTGANLQHAELFNVSFTNGTADGADFDNSNLLGATFASTNLSGASFTGTDVVPTSRDVAATSEDGVNVSYEFSQHTYTGPPGTHPSGCTPNSGSLFAPGTTTVNCSILDDFGGAATGNFAILVYLPSHIRAEPALLSTTGNMLSMTAKVTDAFTGAPIVGGPVEFYANSGSPYGRGSTPTCSASTNASGFATCSLADIGNVPDVLAVIENSGYTAYFLGSGNYSGSNAGAGLVG